MGDHAQEPLADAQALQRSVRTLIALAERWSSATPAATPALSPFAGAPDLNDERAIETSGVLFMEGEGEPVEIKRIKQDLELTAERGEETGAWLAAAMQASWDAAKALLGYPQLADLLGERHRIIGDDWQAAATAQLNARYLRRAVEILDHVDFSPVAVRADRAGPRVAPAYLTSAAELIAHAADLSALSATLVHENERRWRTIRERVEQVMSG